MLSISAIPNMHAHTTCSGSLPVTQPRCSCLYAAPRRALALRPAQQRAGRRGRLQIVAVGWDPEGILAAPKGGHIARRSIQRQAADDEDLKKEMDKAREEARQELTEKREARVRPQNHAELVEYLLDTEGEEMNFEVARCRPLITEDFTKYLTSQIADQRFAKVSNDDRVAELEALQQFLEAAVPALDEVTAKAAAPAERLRKLLQSQDKRATLLEMAGDNEIDRSLLDLLEQNIAAAKASGQEKPAEFMQKVYDAARKYMITI